MMTGYGDHGWDPLGKGDAGTLLDRDCSVCPELVKSLGCVMPVPDMTASNLPFSPETTLLVDAN